MYKERRKTHAITFLECTSAVVFPVLLIEVGYLFDLLRANVDNPQEESSGLRIVLVVTVFLYGAQLRLWVQSYFIMFTVVASYRQPNVKVVNVVKALGRLEKCCLKVKLVMMGENNANGTPLLFLLPRLSLLYLR